MTIDQELLLHKIETASGDITLDAQSLQDFIEAVRAEYREAYEAIKERVLGEAEYDSYQRGFSAGIDEAREVLAGL